MVLESIYEMDLWEYFTKKKESLLSHEALVCQNNDIGVAIYMTAEYPPLSGNGALMKLLLTEDQEEVDSRFCNNEKEARKAYKEFYEYVSGNMPVYDDATDEEEEDEYIQARIEDQETALDDAIYTFIDAASNGSVLNLSDEEVADIKDHFCEYLYRKHGIDVYRPMFLENEDGKDEYFDYPYEEMEFEDEGNPIYQKGVSA